MNWYRKLHPTKEGKRKLRFVTTRIDSLPLFGRAKNHRNCLLKCNQGIVRAGITKGRLWWNPGYAWNGSSPKRYIGIYPLGFWIGTPDFKKTLRPSLGHDILFQFSSLIDISFDEANHHFLLWLETEGFRGAELWHDAVDALGMSHWNKNQEGLTIEYLFPESSVMLKI